MNGKVLMLIGMLLCACKKPSKSADNFLSLKEMSDLATVEYTVTKIIKASDNKTWYKIGERNILMSCEAQIKAGIDMSSINQDNFSIHDESIVVTLPSPKIISISIPPEKITTEYKEIGVFRNDFSSKERDDLAKQAELQINNSLEYLGILQQAKVNTGMFVTNFLKRLGYKNIIIHYAELNPSKQPQ